MGTQMTTKTTEQTPLPELLTVVGEELQHLALAVERLHDIVELPGVRDSLQQAHCSGVLQGIDHVTQNLSGLSEFLATLAAEAPGDCTLDTTAACEVVRIASLCERLKSPTTPRPAASGHDECEFF
jgi:hypothetical protein